MRYLYKLFEADGVTVAGWIRQRRLERCRLDLVDPRRATMPVAAIASRWGFSSSAHFNRAFRAAYGLPPGEYRAEFTSRNRLASSVSCACGQRQCNQR